MQQRRVRQDANRQSVETAGFQGENQPFSLSSWRLASDASVTTICRILISSMAFHNENRNDIQCVMDWLSALLKNVQKKRQTDLQNQKDGV